MLDPTRRFSDRVEYYVRFRPGYPPALLHCLQQHTGLNRTATVADLGAGTGIFTALLLPLAGCVHAVEPNTAMRAAAEQALGARTNFVSHAGTAEATTLPSASVDLITVAQAFHWFDHRACRREFARILKPGGQVALIWNERLSDTTPFLRAYEDLLRACTADYNEVNHAQFDDVAIGGFFAPAAFEKHAFPNEQSFALAGLTGRALSSSYVPNVGQPGHATFLAGLQAIFQRHAQAGCVAFHYRTVLFLGRLA